MSKTFDFSVKESKHLKFCFCPVVQNKKSLNETHILRHTQHFLKASDLFWESLGDHMIFMDPATDAFLIVVYLDLLDKSESQLRKLVEQDFQKYFKAYLKGVVLKEPAKRGRPRLQKKEEPVVIPKRRGRPPKQKGISTQET